MERRTSKNEVKVFKFGARKDQMENEDAALDQIWLQNKYRNALIEIDRKFRGQYNSIVNVNNPSFDHIREIGARIKELRATIKEQRKGVQRRGWRDLSLQEKAQIKVLSADQKALKPEADRVKRENKTVYEPKIKALNQEFKAAVKEVKKRFAAGTYSYEDNYGRHDLGGRKLFWMNEEYVHSNFLKDRDAAMRDKTVLNFHGHQGEGVVTCRPRIATLEDPNSRPIMVRQKISGAKPGRVPLQPGEVQAFLDSNPGATVVRADALRYQKLSAGEWTGDRSYPRNITAQQAFESNNGSAFHFTLPNSEGGKSSRRSQRLKRAVAHLQVGSGEKKTFFSLPVTLHRPFPEGATFKSVAAKRTRLGRNFRWFLLVTVDFPATNAAHGEGIAALDPGWAMETLPERDGRLRVAGLTNERDEFKELALPRDFMSQVEQVSKLQSIIAKETNGIMAKVQEWLEKNREESKVREHFKSAAKAHSNATRRQRQAGGFRHLIKAAGAVWPELLPPERRGEPAKLDDSAFETALKEWYKSFRHHDEWMRNLADQNDARKLHIYRNWAAQAAKQYRTVVIDDADLRKAAAAPSPETNKAQPAGPQRQVAAPSLLVAAFKNAFNSAGGETRWVQGMTSRTCSQCGHVNPPLGAAREFQCQKCAYHGDREFNSGRNLIREHKAGHSSSKRLSTRFRKPMAVLSSPEVCEKSLAQADAIPIESDGHDAVARASSAAS